MPGKLLWMIPKFDSDYITKSGTINFAAGETTKSITIHVKQDKTAELDETFNVSLSSPIGCTISDGLSIGTIINDD